LSLESLKGTALLSDWKGIMHRGYIPESAAEQGKVHGSACLSLQNIIYLNNPEM
jgi:hypothetical protein